MAGVIEPKSMVEAEAHFEVSSAALWCPGILSGSCALNYYDRIYDMLPRRLLSRRT